MLWRPFWNFHFQSLSAIYSLAIMKKQKSVILLSSFVASSRPLRIFHNCNSAARERDYRDKRNVSSLGRRVRADVFNYAANFTLALRSVALHLVSVGLRLRRLDGGQAGRQDHSARDTAPFRSGGRANGSVRRDSCYGSAVTIRKQLGGTGGWEPHVSPG